MIKLVSIYLFNMLTHNAIRTRVTTQHKYRDLLLSHMFSKGKLITTG